MSHVKDIPNILTIAWKIRQNGKRLIPCLSGPSGIGKSQGVHQWVDGMKKQFPDFRMIDLRGATIDASDTRGLPWKDDKTGQTVFLPPDFLPKDGHGVLFIDEVNRSSTPVMNCFMELFTEDRIGNYTLPKGWMIVTAINPGDSEAYDVNSMDAALVNRLTMFNIKFEHKSFVAYGEKAGWSDSVIRYLRSGDWIYKEPGQGDGHYIAPRSWEFMSDAELAGAKEDADLHSEICVALLGKNIGNSYWTFCHKQKPITYADLEKDFLKVSKNTAKIADMPSMKEFEAYANPNKSKTVKGDMISVTIQSFIDHAKKNNKGADGVDPYLLKAVCMHLPADQATSLIQYVSMTVSDPAAWIQNYKKQHADLFARLRSIAVKDGVKTGQ